MENRELKMHDKVWITEWFYKGYEWAIYGFDFLTNLYTIWLENMSALFYPKVPSDIIELISTEGIKEEVVE